MSYEIIIEDCIVDNGYGEHSAEIYVDVEPIIEDCSFDAYNYLGGLQFYGGYQIVDIKILTGTAFLIGNNGVELGEIELDEQDILKHVTKEALLKELIRLYNDDILND